jgi:hypothetical protein
VDGRNARPVEKAFGDPVVARGVAFGIFLRRSLRHVYNDFERWTVSISDRANGIEIQTPCLIDKIGSKIIVRFFCNLLEAYAAVDVPCSR